MKSRWQKFGIYVALNVAVVVITALLKIWVKSYPEPEILRESLNSIYYVPILFAAIFLGETGGAVLAFLAMVATAYLSLGLNWPVNWPEIWPILIRGSFFLTLGYLTARIADRLRSDTYAMQSLLDISRSINATLELDETLQTITTKAVELTSAEACAIRLVSETGDELVDAKSFGLSDRYLQYGPLLTRGIPMVSNLLEGNEVTIKDIRKVRQSLPCFEEIQAEGIISIYGLPLRSGDKVIGQLSLYRKRAVGMARRDLRVARAFAEQAAIALQNAKLYNSIRANYLETVRALTQAIEANDSMTLGHSERVGNVALEMARTLSLSCAEREQLQFGAMLHDIGKIGLHEQMLSKSGGLSADELMLMEMHPMMGKSIIEPVEFLRPCLPIVLYHHERWDGMGYPEGLSGTDIPLAARIVAIADGFDHQLHSASGVTRSKSDALAELRLQAGSIYDPHLVDVLEIVISKELLAEQGSLSSPVAE